MEEKLEKSIKEFNTYVKQYDLANAMINRKYHHTFRVVEYAKDIAKSENLNEHDTYIACICALLHDIARFKQATEFKTYNDALSFDHGDVGYDILVENAFVEKFVDNEIDKNIVLKAVKNHNKFSVSPNLTECELFFTKLVRDADKLDILDIQRNKISDNSWTIDEDVIRAFYEKRPYKRDGTIRNDASEIVKSLCLVFDLNFKRSFEVLKEKCVIERKLKVLRSFVDGDLVDKIRNILERIGNNK